MPANQRSDLGPTIFVLFGATGDLSKRLVLPAFYRLAQEGLLPRQWLLVGNGRGDTTHEDFRKHVRVIRSFRRLDPAEAVLGQFTGYRKVPGVAAKSSQNTFVAARLWIDNPRWRGVPFYLRTGKRLAETKQRVSLVLREPAGPLAGRLPSEANVLSFSMAGTARSTCPWWPSGRVPAWTWTRHRRGPAVPPARRGPAAGVLPADPRRPHRRPVAVHPPGRAGRGVEDSRAPAVGPAAGRVLRAGLVGPGRGAQAHRAGPVAAGAVAASMPSWPSRVA